MTEGKYERSNSGLNYQNIKHGSYTTLKAEVVEALPLEKPHPLRRVVMRLIDAQLHRENLLQIA